MDSSSLVVVLLLPLRDFSSRRIKEIKKRPLFSSWRASFFCDGRAMKASLFSQSARVIKKNLLLMRSSFGGNALSRIRYKNKHARGCKNNDDDDGLLSGRFKSPPLLAQQLSSFSRRTSPPVLLVFLSFLLFFFFFFDDDAKKRNSRFQLANEQRRAFWFFSRGGAPRSHRASERGGIFSTGWDGRDGRRVGCGDFLSRSRPRSGASRELLGVCVRVAGAVERLDRYRDGERVVSRNGTFLCFSRDSFRAARQVS